MRQAPVVGEFLAGSCQLSVIAAFTVVFGIALIVISVFTPAFANAVRDSALGAIDRGLGFVFGVARGLVLLAIVYILYDMLVSDTERIAVIEQAATTPFMADMAEALRAAAPTEMPDWLGSSIERLMGVCEDAGGESAA
jgi:membrane protein required for colicin V production